jgi:opacity protein-like surface antigen
MLFRNKAGLSVLTAVVSATAVAPALADTGFYLGLTAGQSRFHQTKSDGDALAVAGWDSGPDSFTYDIASSSINNNDIAFSAVVGYRFMPEFSIEATYTDLGESKYRSAGTLNFNPFPFTTNGIADITTHAKGPTLAALGTLPLSANWEIYGKAGLIFSRVTLDFDTNMDNCPCGPIPTTAGHSSVVSTTVDPLVGVGAAWHMTNRVTLRAEYTRFIDVGDKDKTTETNIDLINFGVMYSFR